MGASEFMTKAKGKTAAAAFAAAPEKADLGRTFVFKGRRHVIRGLKIGSKTMPVIAEREDGKRFKFPAEAVKSPPGLQSIELRIPA